MNHVGPMLWEPYHLVSVPHKSHMLLTAMAEVERMDNHDPCMFFLPSFKMAHVLSGQISLTGIWLIPTARKPTSPAGRRDAGVC